MDWRAWTVVGVWFGSACGPVVDGEDGGNGSEGSDGTDGSASATGPTTGTTPTPTTAQDDATGDPPRYDLGAPPATLDGVYLFALSAVIDPGHPLQWLASVSQDNNPGGSTLTVELQSLSLDVGSTNAPREPVGEPLVLVIGLGQDGTFGVETPTVEVVGAANPITGSDLVASLVLEGSVFGRELWCGSVFGQVTQPLQLDLTGSTFAFTPIDGGLPDPVTAACPPR